MRIALALGMLLGLVSAGQAHVVVTPAESQASGWERYSVLVPTEKPSPTVRVSVRLPNGMEVIAVEAKPGWEGKHEPFPLGAARVEWTGGSVPPGSFMSFDFLAWNPPATKPIKWEATQWYEDGTKETWGGAANPDHGSTTTLTPGDAKKGGMHRHSHGAGKH